jgi:predicted nucleotide-binding protein
MTELKAFDLKLAREGRSPELVRLSAAIEETLERCFGHGSPAYERLKGAAHLQSSLAPSRNRDPGYFYQSAQKYIERSQGLLQEAQRTLREDLADAQHEAAALPAAAPEAAPLSRRVFVVHGHDDGAREAVARFLEKIGFEAIILHEQANRGGTVIEKIEANSDVGFAVVMLTPDDVGRSAKEEELKPRARQNVLLELGYFIGHLGREKVCALKRGDLDVPSDFTGVVWEKMDDGGGWKQGLGRELQAAGHEIDWNAVMRA